MPLLKYGCALLLLIALVSHADQAASHWKGPYLGAYMGGAWGRANVDTDAGSVAGSSYYNDTADINSVNKSGSDPLNAGAFIGGVQFGHDFMINNVVVGLILDYGAFNLNASHHSHAAYPTGSGNYSEEISIETDWLYTMRARIGYMPWKAHPLLAYITGGFALTNPSLSNEFSDDSSLSGVGGESNDTLQAGWTAGAGLAFPIYQHLTINAEYLYLQFNSVAIDSTISNSAGGFGISPHSLNSPLSTSADLYANVFKMALSYKF